jgi:hypothetical protein
VTRGTDFRGSGRKGSPDHGVPRWRKPSGGERQWWRRRAAKGAGKGVEGAPGVGAKLGAVSGGSKGGRGSGLWWLNDGKHGSAVAATDDEGGKGGSTGGAPFIAAGGGWQMVARVAFEEGRAMEKLGVVERRPPRLERRRHGRRRCSYWVADERGPCSFVFSQIIQTGSKLETENG